MRKIEFKTDGQYLYVGAFDMSDDSKNVSFYTDERIDDHLINNEPHFHLIKKSEDFDCRMYFSGKIIDCIGRTQLDKKIIKAVEYFVSIELTQRSLIALWNHKNPSLLIDK